MGTISMLSAGLRPGPSGNCVRVPIAAVLPGGNWDHLIWEFKNQTSPDVPFMDGIITIPSDYTAVTARFLINWTTTATSGNVRWGLDYRRVRGDNTEAYTQTGTQESIQVTDGAPGASGRKMQAVLNATAANLQAGDDLQFSVYRNTANVADTLSPSAYLFTLLFDYV